MSPTSISMACSWRSLILVAESPFKKEEKEVAGGSDDRISGSFFFVKESMVVVHDPINFFFLSRESGLKTAKVQTAQV